MTKTISKNIHSLSGCFLHPENEGKIVIVPGKLEAVTPLVDEITGVELPGVIAKRTVERYEKVQNSDEYDGIYYTLEWKNTILGKDMDFIGVTYYSGAWCALKGHTTPPFQKNVNPYSKTTKDFTDNSQNNDKESES